MENERSSEEGVSLIIKAEDVECNPNTFVVILPNKAGSLLCELDFLGVEFFEIGLDVFDGFKFTIFFVAVFAVGGE